jgi:hypothetical protein
VVWHLKGSTPERLNRAAPLPSLSERHLHVPWAGGHVAARSGGCPLVPFGMTHDHGAGADAFVDPTACRRLVAAARERLQARLVAVRRG